MISSVDVLSTKSHRRGFSVQELVLSSFLLSLLLALALATVAPALRVSKKAEESMSAQHEVVRAFDQVIGEMSLLDRGGVTVGNNVISYLSYRDFRGNNPVLNPSQLQISSFQAHTPWQKFVVLRHRTNSIWRREYPYADGANMGRITRAALPGIADLAGMQEKKFARDIEEFTVETVGSSRVIFRVRSVTRKASRPEACDVTFQVVMRGSS